MQNPINKPKNKNNLIIALTAVGVVVLMCAVCGTIGVVQQRKEEREKANQAAEPINSAAANTQTLTTSSPVAAKTETKPSPTAAPSLVTWNEYDRVYNVRSNSTDMQKESLWKNYEGKSVNWSGTVAEVSEGSFGGLVLSVKMNKETLTHDVRVELKDDQKNKMMQLTKGEKVTFTGTLKSYGGAVLPAVVENGEIK